MTSFPLSREEMSQPGFEPPTSSLGFGESLHHHQVDQDHLGPFTHQISVGDFCWILWSLPLLPLSELWNWEISRTKAVVELDTQNRGATPQQQREALSVACDPFVT